METFIIIIVVAVVAFYLGWRMHEEFMLHVIKSHPDVIKEALEIASKHQDTEEIIVSTPEGDITTVGTELQIDKENGIMYAYAKATGQFIAQAETIEALLDLAHKRFPGKVFFGNLPEEHQNN